MVETPNTSVISLTCETPARAEGWHSLFTDAARSKQVVILSGSMAESFGCQGRFFVHRSKIDNNRVTAEISKAPGSDVVRIDEFTPQTRFLTQTDGASGRGGENGQDKCSREPIKSPHHFQTLPRGREVPGDKCDRCSREYSYVWNAKSTLWERVTESEWHGLYCMDCFDEMAKGKGLCLLWKPKELVMKTEEE